MAELPESPIDDTEAFRASMMRRAIANATTARLRAMPNPWVGAVLVDRYGVVYDGATESPGSRHAERVALDAAGEALPIEPLSMSILLGWLFAPIAFLMGVPWQECLVVGELLGQKIVLTELIAYIELSNFANGEEAVLSERGSTIASYALCGFANFASIGIQIGGIGGIAPDKMSELASLGFRAMIAGVIAACMTGAVAGLML